MRDTEVLVRFRPWNAEAYVLPGTRLVEAAAEAGVVLEAPCGGEGLCGKCRVLVAAGGGEPTPIEREQLSADELRAGWRLACQSQVREPTEVVVPLPSVKPQIDVEEGSGLSSTSAPLPDPPARKKYVELPPPARGDDLPDLLRLERAIGGETLEIDLPLLRTISSRLREADFRGTAVLADGRLLDFEPGNTAADAFAVALDLGTTTLVAELLDLGVGARWAVEAGLNPQTRFGDDVLSRILYARQTPEGLRQLQETVASAVDEMIGQLCGQADIARDRIYELAVSGNTTMQQLLCGIDTSPLGEVPFVPAGGRGLACLARELGINIHPRGAAYVMPVIGGFVGGDTVAGILAAGMFDGAETAPRSVLSGADIPVCPACSISPGGQECLPHPEKRGSADDQLPTLFVDIGTNGEIVLLADGRLSAASTAAGPAFEGARISCGMRGCSGAIEKVVVEEGQLRINVIGNVPPTGLCGSGLIDAAAELLRHGIVTPQGRLLTPERLPPGVSPELAERVVLHDGQVSFLLAAKGETADGRPIALTQRDLRELQLASGAIRAGIVILLRRAGLEPSDLDRVLIGGGFGNFIRRSNAQRIGLLPCQIEHHRIRYMGNTSLAGARLAALSRRARAAAEQLARCTEHVDLSCDVEFHREFAEAMIFPEA